MHHAKPKSLIHFKSFQKKQLSSPSAKLLSIGGYSQCTEMRFSYAMVNYLC